MLGVDICWKRLQVINISSPNTPGLRKLQGRKQLQDLIKKVLARGLLEL
jgi:dihydroorotate dehydrogenase